MKKTLLMFASFVLATMSALALPTKPEVKTFTPWASAAKGYLYNVEAGMFITNGCWWGTNACGADNGANGSGNDYTFEAVRLGTAKLSGTLFEVGEADPVEGDATEYFSLNNVNKGDNAFLTFDGGNETDIWVDGGTGRPYNRWFIVKNDDNTFKLIYNKDSVLNVAGFKYFDEGNIHVIMNTADAPYTKWALVSEAVYNEVIGGLNLYYVAGKLDELVTKAKGQGISKDFSGYEALLASDTTSYDSYAKANASLNPLIGLGDSIVAAKALDAARDWSLFEAVYADDSATTAQIDSTLTNLKSVMALKKGLLSAEAGHDWSSFEAIYNAASTTADLDSALTNLNAYKSLKAKLDDAVKEYPNLDFSAAKTVYDATGKDNAELAAAEAKIDDIIADYNMSLATVEKPADVTNLISGIDGSSIADWTRVWLGNGETGAFQLNTWSTEATEDGMVTPFIENWVGAGSNLSDQKIYRNPVSVRPGAYKITVKARLFNESEGATFLTGANVFANLNAKSITKSGIEDKSNAIEGATYGDYNGKLYYYKDDFEGYGIVTADSSLIFGMLIQDANCNWLAHKNYKVYYLGDSYASLDFVRKNSELLADAYAESTVGQKVLIADYNKAVNDYKNAADPAAISAGYANISLLADSVAANIAAYKAYSDRLAYIREYMSNPETGGTLSGASTALLSDYISEGNVAAPGDDYVNGSAAYILSNLALSTPQIEAELEYLNTLLDNAIRNEMTDGTSLTDLIVNPGFEQSGGTGWSLDTSKGGTSSLTNWHGGSSANYCAEAYEQNFDVYQIIEGVPNGLYEVSVQAFYRTGANDVAFDAYKNDPTMEGDAKVYPEVYFNAFSSKIRNVMEIQFDENLADNCYATPDGTYTLNGMNSASAAFSLEDPEQNFTMSAYGLVTDGKIRLGIRKLEGPTSGAVWTLWDNFKLTYRAKNAEALESVIESIIDQYAEYVSLNADYINELEAGIAADAIDAAGEAYEGGDAEEMYEALIALNDAYVATQAHVSAMTALFAAVDELTDAINEYGETATEEALDQAQAVATEADDIDNLTTAEIIALTERIKDAIPALKIPKDVEDASDDNAVDMTDLIVNADFAVEFGAAGYGWEYTKNGGNGPSYSNAFEFWNGSGAQELRFNIWQDIKALPAGKYELTAVAANALNGQADLNNPGRAFLYASTFVAEGDTTTYSSDPVRITEGDATNEDNQDEYSVIFTVEAGQTVRVGFKSSGVMTARWFIGKDFQLTYFGTESEKEDSGDPSGVEAIAANGAEIVAIYTVSGAQVATLQKGINIVKYSDGTIKKLIVQ